MNTTTKASLGATVVLLVIALVIAVQNMTELKTLRQAKVDADTQIEKLQADLDHERATMQNIVLRQQEPAAPAVVKISPDMEARFKALESRIAVQQQELIANEKEKNLLADRAEKLEIVNEANLNEEQKKIRDAQSIGTISHVEDELGFAVITAGASSNIEPGINFAIRRNHRIVGKVTVSSVESANESIVNIVQGSVQPGQQIKKGDTVIGFPIY